VQKSKSCPRSAIQKPEVLSKMPEMVRNAVKFIFIRKCVRKVVVIKPEVVVYIGQHLVKSEFGVAVSEKRVAAIFLLLVWPLEPLGCSFLPYSGLYCRGIAHRRLEMISIRKRGAPNLNLWPESTIQKPEVLSKVHEMVRKVVKLTIIRKSSWSDLK